MSINSKLPYSAYYEINISIGYEDGTKRVCKLKRSLYGLKQAPRCWNKCFGQFLLKLDFKVSDADPCLYIREKNGKKLIIALYVDDGLIAANDQQECEIFIEKLKARFKIVTGNASGFLVNPRFNPLRQTPAITATSGNPALYGRTSPLLLWQP